jgi:hypothetical protein
MRLNLIAALSILFLSCTFYSCKKDDNPTPPAPPPVTDSTTKPSSININLSTSTPGEEIIITETGGKVLLDTMSPYPNALVATLNTTQTLVDFSVVSYDTAYTQYVIKTYKGVNPSKWLSVDAGTYYLPALAGGPTLANVVYKNPPAVSFNGIWIADYAGYNLQSGFSYPPGYIVINYSQYSPTNYVYFLLGAAGLYNFHIPQGINDTVDLSHMDTAVMLNFNVPGTFTVSSNRLNGIMDTTDFTKSIWLSPDDPAGSTAWNIEYPRKLVQEMELFVTATSPNGSALYYSYGDTISPTLPLLDQSAYTLSSMQFNNFAEKFTTVHPSYYYTQWVGGEINYQLYASPDSTNLNPQALLTSLNSKILQGQTLSGLSLYAFYFENATGFNYADFFSYVHNPAQLKSRRVSSSVNFTQGF